MIRNNILTLIKVLIMLYTTQSICQTAATQLARFSETGGEISAPGSYYLGFDVMGEITINASNVILDLNGHLVTGSISISEFLSDVTIMNGCTIDTNNTSIISVTNCNNIQLANLTIRNNGSGSGITITSSTNVIIEEVVCCGLDVNSLYGIELNACSSAMISKCLCRNWNIGITIIGSSNAILVEECYISGTARGLSSIESTDTTILNCTSFSNDTGFYFEGDSSVDVSNCIADNNQNQGFEASDASDIYLTECLAFNNTTEGFNIKGNDDNKQNFVSKCVAISNGTGFLDPSASVLGSIYTTNYADANTDNYNTGNAFKALPANSMRISFWRNTIRPDSNRECGV